MLAISAVKPKSPFNFLEFKAKFKEDYPDLKLPDDIFLEWLIGFVEGEGSFILAKRGDLSFVITQSGQDINVLNYIKNNLGFGRVILQSKKQNTYRFVVQDFKSLYLICLLFNGNMIFPTRKARFFSFLSSFNERLIRKNLSIIIPIYNNIMPSLHDGWLAGITDGEGSFTCSLLSNSISFRFRFILTQKWEANKCILDSILNSFSLYLVNGSVVRHNAENVWELRINGLSNCEGLFTYFDNFPLVSKKKQSYIKWKELHVRLINKEHLNSNTRPGGSPPKIKNLFFIKNKKSGGRPNLINLAKQINK